MSEKHDWILDHPLLIMFEGEPQYYLNPGLAEAKGIIGFVDGNFGKGFKIDFVDVEHLNELKELHVQKLILFKAMEETDDPVLLKAYANNFEQIEFAMQQCWGFEMDRNHHRWFEVPKCTCPKMDNADRIGTPYRIHTADCPIHGGYDVNKVD